MNEQDLVKQAEAVGWHHIYCDGPPDYTLYGYKRHHGQPDEDGERLPDQFQPPTAHPLTPCQKLE